MKYHRQLMTAILYDKIQIAKAVNVQVITLNEAPQGYVDFDKGAAKKICHRPPRNDCQLRKVFKTLAGL